ncbi:hypothetical protein [Nafulsella turpanensis]|uniref:hypothetical protein n=1 Tax=Nafulsella turpanensis TaxID=1265690 RepID=UPI00034BE566|nr:hypothetical protein [Nafulsella turpanensis]
MAVTRLKRKGRRNKTNSLKRTTAIKRLTATPVIKNVDVESLKEGFAGGDKKASAKKQEEPKKEAAADKE